MKTIEISILLFVPSSSFKLTPFLTRPTPLFSERRSIISLDYSFQKHGHDPSSATMPSMNKKTALPVSRIIDPETSIPTSSFLNATSVVNPFVVSYDDTEVPSSMTTSFGFDGKEAVDRIMNSYLGPRILLAAVACLYGTNFPLGAIMDSALPASAATSSRMLLAAAALSPFLSQLPRELIGMSVLAGSFTATGYVAQSMALVDTSPATVSFLGAATVVWCPMLEWLVHKTPMGWKDRPQTWISAFMCMLGVGVLELCGSDMTQSSVGMGDLLALLQAMGFGTGIFMSEQMMRKHPTKALPITSAMVATSALVSMGWALSDGWIGNAPGWESMTLPNMLFDPNMKEVAIAVVWTGLLSTSMNFFLEVFALGSVPSGEASVILASEPLWAAAFASILMGEEFGWNDYAGGSLIVMACVISSLQISDFKKFFVSNDDANAKH